LGKPNDAFKKYQKELAQQKKQEAKQQRKLERQQADAQPTSSADEGLV
jgi:hypothetical protein